MASTEREEGWGNPLNARTSHYFRGGRSLCGGWLCFSPVWDAHQELGEEATKGTCKACWRKRAAEVKKES